MQNWRSHTLDLVDHLVDARGLITALLAALATGATAVVVRLWQRRRWLGWNVLLNESVNQPVDPSDNADATAGAAVDAKEKGSKGKGAKDKAPKRNDPNIWEITKEGHRVEDGSFALIELRNVGSENIGEEHFANPITFTFEGRKVVHFKVRDSEELHQIIQRGEQTLPPDDPSKLVLPPLPLNRKSGFKILVLLTGSGRAIKVSGLLRSGRIVQLSRYPTRRVALALAGAFMLVVGATSGALLADSAANPAPACAAGHLVVQGSSAFASIATLTKNGYEDRCAHVSIDVKAVGSVQGYNDLASAKSPNTIAMVDTPLGGPTSASPALTRRSVGVVVFAVVANTQIASRPEWKDLFTHGREASQLFNAFDRPEASGLVAVVRGGNSGTRQVFNRAVAHSDDAFSAGATPCPVHDANQGGRCSVDTTMDMLAYVNATPNAIGYAEADALPFFPNVQVVPFIVTSHNGRPDDGLRPTRDNAINNSYPLVAVENLYMANVHTELADDFLAFLSNPAMAKRLQDTTFIACADMVGAPSQNRCDGG